MTSEAIRRADELRQSAIALLLTEKGEIEEALARLGWPENGEPTNGKRRGRPPKEKSAPDTGAPREDTSTPPAEL